MVKRRSYYLIFSSITAAIFFILYLFNIDSNENHPNKFKGISTTAQWYGGKDGGCWIDVGNDLNGSMYMISIFNDNTGKLEYKGYFKICDNCWQTNTSVSFIKSHILGFDGENILLNLLVNGNNCYLKKAK